MQLVNADSDDKPIELTVTYVKKGDKDAHIFSGLPIVSVYFE